MSDKVSKKAAEKIDIIKEAWLAHQKRMKAKYAWYKTIRRFCKTRPNYRLLKVTAILTKGKVASLDKITSLYDKMGDDVIPKEPYLRNPFKHEKGNPYDNYVRDWITLANLQLLYSGANFGLDTEDIEYEERDNDVLHNTKCGDGEQKKTIRRDYFPDDETYERVVVVFRWGDKDKNRDSMDMQGCSGEDVNHILMPGLYKDVPFWTGGQLVFGDNKFTHELGHFLGLPHPFHSFMNKLTNRVNRLGDLHLDGNPRNLPINEQNFGKKYTDKAQKIQKAREKAKTDIENETGLDADKRNVNDTDADLGFALPLLFGRCPCKKGKDTYNIEVTKGEKTYTIDDDIRLNIMGYWTCDPEAEYFSHGQVNRMQKFLEGKKRKALSDNAKKVQTTGLISWVLMIAYLAENERTWKPVKYVMSRLWDAISKNWSHYQKAWDVLRPIVHGYSQWDEASLLEHLNEELEKYRKIGDIVLDDVNKQQIRLENRLSELVEILEEELEEVLEDESE